MTKRYAHLADKQLKQATGSVDKIFAKFQNQNIFEKLANLPDHKALEIIEAIEAELAADDDYAGPETHPDQLDN